MPLKIVRASEPDAPLIADIHMSAFGTNPMLQAQFPTPAARDGLRTSLVDKALAEMRDPKWEVLLVKDDRTEEIISFAKWCRPAQDHEDYVEQPWTWPDGTAMDVLEAWTEKVEAVSTRVVGTRPCYRLSFMATKPSHERRGAASLLINWGLQRSNKERVPIVLESTLNAAALYERLGFQAAENISLVMNQICEGGEALCYEEICFIFWPDTTTRI